MEIKRGIKAQKTRPASANMVKLWEVPGVYTTYWKGRAKPKRRGAKKASKPKPKKWVPIVIFLHDTERRKRSYHVAWNGERLNDTADSRALWEREPKLAKEVESGLDDMNHKLIKNWEENEWKLFLPTHCRRLA